MTFRTRCCPDTPIQQNSFVMQIVGVIDLKGGIAVHARGGNRERYEPVRQSAGAAIDGSPMALARLYNDRFGLSEIYVADLDAIASQPLQADTLRRIGALGAALWVDAGIATADDTKPVLMAGAQTLVVGLETLASFDALANICTLSTRPVAFSLDLRAGTPMNGALGSHSPEAIARKAVDAGAQRIIVLDVARVGVGGGPDFDLLRRIRPVVPGAQLLAGGGVRGIGDLRQLADIGCAGALVASALLDGRLCPADVAGLRGHIGRTVD